MILIGAVIAGAFVGFVGWFAWEIHQAPLVDDVPYEFMPDDDCVIVAAQGVEIPVSWLAQPDDLDDVLATLLEIDQLGTGATA